jgi:hypothetical protein
VVLRFPQSTSTLSTTATVLNRSRKNRSDAEEEVSAGTVPTTSAESTQVMPVGVAFAY